MSEDWDTHLNMNEEHDYEYHYRQLVEGSANVFYGMRKTLFRIDNTFMEPMLSMTANDIYKFVEKWSIYVK